MEIIDVIVVGAGIAGLLAAERLQNAGVRVLVLEKTPEVGGRMNTREVAGDRIDLGAQFFTVRQGRFHHLVKKWRDEGLVSEWSKGWEVEDGYPRYVVREGMVSIPKFLSQTVDVQPNSPVESISPTSEGWQIDIGEGPRKHGRALLLTPPVPLSLGYLDAGKTNLHPSDRSALARIQYAPCLTGIFQIEGSVHFPFPGAVYTPEETIIWMADNKLKGLSHSTWITVHAGPGFSTRHYESEKHNSLSAHLEALRPYLDKNATILQSELIRWPFSRPLFLHPNRTLFAQRLPPLVFAGDAFFEPRVEGAALSGLTAADILIEKFFL